jgi:hypothetical protein
VSKNTRILSDYLDTLIYIRKLSRSWDHKGHSDRHLFGFQHGPETPSGRLLAGKFRECVPVLGDEPCEWALSNALVKKRCWKPEDDGVPLASPWSTWFLDVRAPKRVEWGGPEEDWFGPPTWGWIVTQEESTSRVVRGAKWSCRATLVLPHRSPEIPVPAATDWSITWYLDAQGLAVPLRIDGVSAPTHYTISHLPAWRTEGEANNWCELLSAPLWRTLQLFNVKDSKQVFPHPQQRRKKRKTRKDRKGNRKPEITYCVLRIDQERGGRGPGGGGTHASPAFHLRRGHFANYGYHDRKGPDGSCNKCGGAPPHEGICGTGHFGRGKAVSIWVPAHTVGTKSRGERVNIYSPQEEEQCAEGQA